jgi:hypothetical protein
MRANARTASSEGIGHSSKKRVSKINISYYRYGCIA